jgi:hypothetical protein
MAYQLATSFQNIFKLIDCERPDDSLVILELEEFIKLAESHLDSLINNFRWNKNTLFQDNANKILLFTCPFNSGHSKISAKNFDKHVYRCSLKHNNYTKEDIVLFLFYPRLKLLSFILY